MKSVETVSSQKPARRLHLHFIRLPNQVLELCDDLVYRSKGIIVGRSKITSAHSVMFDDRVVLKRGFPIIYFELLDHWFSIVKVRDLQGRHTGYYCDIATPPRQLKDGALEFTDLFLDLWVSPDLRYKVLDEEELEDAFRRGWIRKQLYDRAKRELKRLVRTVERGDFPPYLVKRLEAKLCL
mgnify:CR=1 FL=1